MSGHDQTPQHHEHTDDWHHHSAAEGVPQHEHASIANPSVLIHWLILIGASMIVVITALAMYFGRAYNEERQTKIETLYFYDNYGAPPRDAAESTLGVNTPLDHYSYKAANAQNHTVQLPIEQAMKKVVDKYQATKSASASSPQIKQ